MKTRGWRHPLSKKTNARAAGPLPGLRGKLVIAALALALALAPVGTYAGLADAAAVPGAAVSGAADAHDVAATAPLTADDAAQDAPADAPAAPEPADIAAPPRFVDEETRPLPPVDPDDVSEHTMTFYYYEPMDYEDPDYSHPSGIRLLKKRVVTGLKAGQELDTWDYVEQIEGHVFFDAYPSKPVVSSDESKNYVELVYFKTMDNACTVNYFEVKGTPGAVVGSDDIAIEKMGEFTIENQRYDQKIEGRQVAAPIDEMVYLDSYPQSIRLKADPADNVINVFYADTLATLPDATPVPDADAAPDPDAPVAPGPDVPTTPGDGSGSGDADGSDKPEVVPPADGAVPPAGDDADKPAGDGDADGSAGDATPPAGDAAKPEGGSGAEAPGIPAPAPADPPATSGSDSAAGAPAPKVASGLPQTGDALPAAIVGSLAAAAAAGAALLAASRRLRATRR